LHVVLLFVQLPVAALLSLQLKQIRSAVQRGEDFTLPK